MIEVLPHSRRRRWVLPAVSLFLAALVGYFLTTHPSGRDETDQVVMAKNFTLPDLTGRPVTLSSFRGQVVLLDFWATWCGPCQEEVPDLKALHERYKNKGFTVLGVSMDAMGREVVLPFVKELGIQYPILLGVNGPPPGYHIPGYPTAFLIDRNGKILTRYLGPMSLAEFSQDVERALALK